MNVPFFDMQRHIQRFQPELTMAWQRVCARAQVMLGPECLAFENEFAMAVGTHYAVGVANGTDALELALRAGGIGSGSTVITAANAGMYATTAIQAVGARPVYLDIDPSKGTLASAVVEQFLQSVDAASCKAVIVTHLYGQAADIESILEHTRAAGLLLIEDCAQAHGAVVGGRTVGSWGHMGCFSFYPTKNLGALGDAGMVVTNDPNFNSALCSLRQYGWKERYRAEIPHGRNSRMDELQAAILRVKLPYLNELNTRRREIYSRYAKELQNVVQFFNSEDESFVAHLAVVRSPYRDDYRRLLAERGVETSIHYPLADHQQAAVQSQVKEAQSLQLPVTERMCREVFSLPCFPELEDDEVSYIIASVREAAVRIASVGSV